MLLTRKQKLLQYLWIKTYTPEGHEISREETVQQTDSGLTKRIRIYVPETGEEVAEMNYIQRRRFGFNKWVPTLEWCGPNNLSYLLFNHRTPN
ncbi:MAG: hypothetical protein AABY22_23630 [Nanoarchaeota archaeon]